MVKVSLDKVIIDFKRIISDEEVVGSIANQKFFEFLKKHEDIRELGFDIFSETAGLILKNSIPGKSFTDAGGQIVREFPKELLEEKEKWLSFASLMSPNSSPPLIMKIIAQSDLSSIEFIKKYLIDEYIKYFKNLLKIGLKDAPHAQNLGFITDSKYKPLKVFTLKDFADYMPDFVRYIENDYPLEIYEDVTEKHLSKGRDAGIISFTYYYRRQVFDMLVREIAKHDKVLISSQITKLRKELDKKHIEALNRFYGFSFDLSIFPKRVYKKIQNQLIEDIKFVKTKDFIELNNNYRVNGFLHDKYLEKRIIAYKSSKHILDTNNHIFIKKNILYVVKNNLILGMLILTNNDEEKVLKFERLEGADKIRLDSCQLVFRNIPDAS